MADPAMEEAAERMCHLCPSAQSLVETPEDGIICIGCGECVVMVDAIEVAALRGERRGSTAGPDVARHRVR